jgi:PIN domain nuclease of toxin-antitoxin system
VSSAIVDSSSVLALLQHEPGADDVASAIAAGALIVSVNLSEVVAKLAGEGVAEQDIRERLAQLALQVVAFDAELAFRAGMLRSATRAAGLSLGDRACLALALERNLPALTADRNWQRVQIGVEVRLIR